MIMTNDILFEDGMLDAITDLAESSIFDEYVNYDRILSDSVMLSEAQEMKLELLREFSIEDIKNKLANVFKKIKEFILNIITKIKVFFKNIGKDKVFKNVGEALKKLTPEQRAKNVAYGFVDLSKVGKKSINTSKIDKINELVAKIRKADEKELKEIEQKGYDDYIIANGASVADVIKVLSEQEFTVQIKNAPVATAYNDITKMSKQLDNIAGYAEKIGNKLAKQADGLSKEAKSIKSDKPGPARVLQKVAVPALKGNSSIFKSLNKEIVKLNKTLLKEAVKLVKGKENEFGGNLEDISKKAADVFNVDLGDIKLESYDPWAGIE